jgi:HK97 family phage prohead protease
MSELEIRHIELRAENDEERIIEGIAVPYGVETNVGAYVERFAKDSISDDVSEVKLKFGHEGLPIGKVIEGRNAEDGFYIRAKISETSQGNDVYTLIRDGVLNKFSVGFVPVESERDGNTVVRKMVSLREVSVVEQPAYSDAEILAVREETLNNTKEIQMESINENANLEFAVRSVQDEVAELRRAVEAGVQVATPTQTVDTRSAGQVLKAIAAGDEATIRTYAGNTTDNSVMLNTFIGDLTRIVDSPIGVRGLISTGVLPASGNILEYAVLDSNDVGVGEQEAEGDDLTYGQVSLTTATAPVKTFGGYTTLTRQAIERSSVNFLDAHMRAMAVAVANNLNGFVRGGFLSQHAAHVTTAGSAVVDMGISGTALTAATYTNWLDAIVEGADKFQNRGWGIDALVVSKDVFKSLMALEGSDGRPLLLVQGNNGVNTVGQVNPLALGGSFAGLRVAVDTALGTNKAAFVNGNAMRLYTNPVVSLTDDNIINLSRDFSVYQYAALATEAPEALVPVVA